MAHIMTDCKDCGEKFMGPSFATRCPSCYDSYLAERAQGPMRACSSCKALTIPLRDPIYKIFCSNCYKEKSRPCSICDRRIAPNSPTYQVKCTQCFLAERALSHERCPVCPPERANRLTMRKGEQMCNKCKLAYQPHPSSTPITCAR